ncbi:MAG TPA: response regulator [Chloroflexi bacterium]|nr:response regulator [Chloroflexota bacterium]
MSTDRGIRVLYVEDEPAIAELLKSGLDLFGIEVSPIYGSAEEAYEQILKGEPPISECQMLVFDIRLPGMTGLELSAKLREAGETRPILIVSAYQPPPRSQLEELNAHFMPKPFDFAGIVSKIQELVG